MIDKILNYFGYEKNKKQKYITICLNDEVLFQDVSMIWIYDGGCAWRRKGVRQKEHLCG